MIQRAVVVTLALLTVPAGVAAAAPKAKPPAAPRLVPDDLPGPEAEAIAKPAKVDLPAVPAFDLPASEPGFHGPRELRVRGKSLLGTEIKVKGYVTWVYDCAAALAIRNPKASRAQITQSIEKNPALCEYPKFYLGDARDTSRDASIWVADVDKRTRVAPGDFVVATGTWSVSSPRGEANTEGLLVFKAVEKATPAPPGTATSPERAAPPAVAVDRKIPLRAPVPEETRNASVGKLNECNRARTARQLDAAITACDAAIAAWDGNHLAWYARASTRMARNEWPAAVSDTERAVTLRPDQGMYHLYHGISLFEAELQRVSDPAQRQLGPAEAALLRAITLQPELWRGHYYLGRLYRELDDARRAAEQLTLAITTHPAYRFSYLALFELYRRWDYLDAALAVALAGTVNVAPAEAPELWTEAGMAYDAKHADDQALAAYGKALAGKPDDLRAKFQRGQIYVRRGDTANARKDLEDVIKSTDPRMASARQLAQQLLARITAGKK